jgi:tetratricopeptide (TPR) repeat protein
MKKNPTTRKPLLKSPPADDGAVEAQLSRFGFGDPWDSWMERIRELEWPRMLGSIGAYELLDEAGRGGQGIVYKARLTTTGRIVAIKRLVGGAFASAESRRRLEREMEAAAVLSDDSIVRVLGMDLVDGQPLLAMEWVDGEPITAWARGRDIPSVLNVFAAVCEAVHHAHQRGVLHRDLKPSNILVDRTGRPRVLDFGLAKFMTPGREPLTRTEQFLGTPGYAPPEHDERPADVRGDVYALGVVLFEMLTGAMPFEGRAARGRSADTEPRRPSQINPSLPPALGAVVLRAIEHDADRRYQSVGELVADIRRFLAGEPVEAQNPGAILRTRRFLRRHRVAAAFVATIAVLVTGWGVVAGVLTLRLAARTEEARAAEQRTARINGFLLGLLGTARPTQPGADAGMLVAVDQAAGRVDAELADDPLVCSGVHASLGRIYLSLRMTTQARTHLDRALELRRAAGQAGDRDFTDLLRDQGVAQIQSRDIAGVGTLREARARAARVGDELRIAACDLALGDALRRTGADGTEAESLIRGAVARVENALGPTDPRAAAARAALGACLNSQGRHASALEELDRAAAVLAPLCDIDSEHMPALAECQYERAAALLALGRAPEALTTLLDAMPTHHCLYGGTRDAEWYWRWAMIGHADQRAGTLDTVHEAFAAAWRHAEPPVGGFAGLEDWTEFFSADPLASAEPVVYARRSLEALAKIGEPESTQLEYASWLAARLDEAGYAGHSQAIRGMLNRPAASTIPADIVARNPAPASHSATGPGM